MAQHTQQLQTALEQKQKTELEKYSPAMLDEDITPDPVQIEEARQRWKINPDETALAYVLRHTPRPQTMSDKEAQRRQLFAAIGDAATVMADNLTLAQGGLVDPRASNLATASKAVQAQRAVDAKNMKAYSDMLRDAILSDRKESQAARKGLSGELGRIYADAGKAARDARMANVKAQNDADKFNAGQANAAAEKEAHREFTANQNDLNRKTRIQAAGMYAQGRQNQWADHSYFQTKGGFVLSYPVMAARQHKGTLDNIARKILEKESDNQDFSKMRSKARNNELTESDVSNIVNKSDWADTPEGRAFLQQQQAILNAPPGAFAPTAQPSQTKPNLLHTTTLRVPGWSIPD